MSNQSPAKLPDLTDYPELLKPRDVQRLLGISKERSYALFHLEGFPKVITGKSALCVPKARLIVWLGYGQEVVGQAAGKENG